MPNHVSTVCRVTASPATIQLFKERHILDVEDGKRFAMETVVERPECVNETESGGEADAAFWALTGLLPCTFPRLLTSPVAGWESRGFDGGPLATHDGFCDWLREHHPDILKKGEAQVRCFRETGYRSWYDWAPANWGTKWNAYSYESRSESEDTLVFKFETAWAFPVPVFERLADMYPEAKFAVRSIDEGGPEYEGEFSGDVRKFEEAAPSDDRFIDVYGQSRAELYGDEE